MKPISTSNAPAAIGPYSQAVDSGAGLVFLSGQLPIDPATGAFPEGGIQAQTRQSLRNVQAILAGWVNERPLSEVYTDDGQFREDVVRAALDEENGYLVYIELRNAIEQLGEEAPERSFSDDDPEYESLRDLDR